MWSWLLSAPSVINASCTSLPNNTHGSSQCNQAILECLCVRHLEIEMEWDFEAFQLVASSQPKWKVSTVSCSGNSNENGFRKARSLSRRCHSSATPWEPLGTDYIQVHCDESQIQLNPGESQSLHKNFPRLAHFVDRWIYASATTVVKNFQQLIT